MSSSPADSTPPPVRRSPNRTPDTAPDDLVERQQHLHALALADLICGTGTAAAPGASIVVIDAGNPTAVAPGRPTSPDASTTDFGIGSAALRGVDWGIPVELPERVLRNVVDVHDPDVVIVADNLLPVCQHHHTRIHTDLWRLVLGPHRQLTVTLPVGHTMSTGPPTIRAA